MIYPAIFHKEEQGYSVSFPDLSGCFTEGDTLEEALAMSEEALGLYITALEDENQEIPTPSQPNEVPCNEGDFVSLVSVSLDKYRQKNKAIKKTLTIPSWLNEQAERANINFSQTLQRALKEELQLVE